MYMRIILSVAAGTQAIKTSTLGEKRTLVRWEILPFNSLQICLWNMQDIGGKTYCNFPFTSLIPT